MEVRRGAERTLSPEVGGESVGAFARKFKGFMDWMQHVRLVVDVLVGLGAGTVLKGLLSVLTHLDRVWITPIWLLTAAAVTFAMTKVRVGWSPEQSTSTIQNAASSTIVPPPPPPVNFDAAAIFRTAYTSSMTAEAEKNFRLAAEQSQPNDREGFLLRLIGIGAIAYLHDLTWAYIYRSQLRMLLELNRRGGLMTLADAKLYYDQAVSEFPEMYSKYSYEEWLEFVKSHQLIIQHPSNMLEITVRGKDLLKYLTHWGRYPEARRG